MKLRQTGREMQNAMANQATIQVSQLAQIKGKQPHGYALHQELVSSTFYQMLAPKTKKDYSLLLQ